MAILKSKEISKMNKKDRESKLKDLRFEIVRAGVTANKASAKTKEIKRTIARLITFSKSDKEELKKK